MSYESYVADWYWCRMPWNMARRAMRRRAGEPLWHSRPPPALPYFRYTCLSCCHAAPPAAGFLQSNPTARLPPSPTQQSYIVLQALLLSSSLQGDVGLGLNARRIRIANMLFSTWLTTAPPPCTAPAPPCSGDVGLDLNAPLLASTSCYFAALRLSPPPQSLIYITITR